MSEQIAPNYELDIETAFTYHAPKGDQIHRYQVLREEGKKLANSIDINTPLSTEKTTALRKVREAIMWANAAIAVNEAIQE